MLKVFRKYPDIILSYKITKFEQFGKLYKLRAEIELIDHSKLFIRETILDESNRKYAYHWQDQDGSLIIRWDNSPDWEIETFPHHKHVGGKDKIEPSYERTLDQVMPVLTKRIEKRKNIENVKPA